jgi:hypothetical protein
MTVRETWVRALVVVGVAAVAAPAVAERSEDGRTERGGAAQASVDRDGRVRAPTREEAAALREALRQQFEPAGRAEPQAVRLASGGLVVQLDERFESVVVATMRDGTLEGTCVTSAAEAERALAPPAEEE